MITKIQFSNLIFLLLLACCCTVHADSYFVSELNRLVKANQSYSTVGLEVVDLKNSKRIFAHNQSASLKPASVLKLLITAYALKVLGPDYRFETELRYAGLQGARLDTLIIKGQGDPNFRTEDLWTLLRQLKRFPIKEIRNLYIDASSFLDASERSGQRAYQTGSSGLAFNFNTFRFSVCPNGSSLPGRALVWHEPYEYPVSYDGTIRTGSGNTQIAIQEKEISAGLQHYQISGNINSSAECKDIYRSVQDPVHYLGLVTKEFLKKLDIVVRDVKKGASPLAARTIAKHQSKPLSQILADLNKFSNNFIAEQLLRHIGSRDGFYQRKLGLRNLENYIQDLGFSTKEFHLSDASGLSHDNRISVRILSEIMRSTLLNPAINIEFENTLAVNQQTGTLRKFNGDRDLVLRAKTGTINGVDSIAGLVNSKKIHKYLFVLIQNNVRSFAKAQEFERKFISLLHSQ